MRAYSKRVKSGDIFIRTIAKILPFEIKANSGVNVSLKFRILTLYKRMFRSVRVNIFLATEYTEKRV